MSYHFGKHLFDTDEEAGIRMMQQKMQDAYEHFVVDSIASECSQGAPKQCFASFIINKSSKIRLQILFVVHASQQLQWHTISSD